MNETLEKIGRYVCLAALAGVWMTGCSPAPGVRHEPEPVVSKEPSPPKGFVMKSFHRSMIAEMRRSFDRANEIVIGVLTGSHEDKKNGLVYYFSDFTRFDKETLSWGTAQNVIMQVRPYDFAPEIIERNEFKTLIDMDKIGICWDFYQGNRSVFLVEGKMNLVFLEMGFDEASGQSYRHLIDAYPVTDECRARDVFDLMIQDRLSKTLFSPFR